MTARRKSAKSSALSNPSGGGRCSSPAVPRYVAWQARRVQARSRMVRSGRVRQVRLGSERHGAVR
jgi:hypothetical protein